MSLEALIIFLFVTLFLRRARQPTPVFLSGKDRGQRRNLVGYSPWVVESDISEVTYHARSMNPTSFPLQKYMTQNRNIFKCRQRFFIKCRLWHLSFFIRKVINSHQLNPSYANVYIPLTQNSLTCAMLVVAIMLPLHFYLSWRVLN